LWVPFCNLSSNFAVLHSHEVTVQYYCYYYYSVYPSRKIFLLLNALQLLMWFIETQIYMEQKLCILNIFYNLYPQSLKYSIAHY
jgi:hypothetical protein